MQFTPRPARGTSSFPRPLDGSSREADRWLGWGDCPIPVSCITPLPNPPPQGGREIEIGQPLHESPSPSMGEGWGGGESLVTREEG